ncbi:MAG TPA: M48 family metalloprotease, partial [Thermomicrobiaceae bacterium]|nr:M48 family metalloprotease [Thermomicrobiaceae bacterium]
SKQTKKANAFFAGLGGTKRIVLGDTLVEDFSPEEIEVVVAHEMGHQAHRDIWRLVTVGTLGTAASTFVVERAARWAVERFPRRLHLRSLDDVAALPLLAFISGLVGLVLMPLANAYSRRLERRADTFALNLTRTPRAFIGSMRRLAEQNLADPNPSALVKYLLYSHPPIEQRIAHAQEWESAHE